MDVGQIFVLVAVVGIATLFVWAEIKARRQADKDDGSADKKP